MTANEHAAEAFESTAAQATSLSENTPANQTTHKQVSKQVLSRASSSIVQIQALFEGNTEKSSHGTGFIVGPNGLAITNYHVVSDRVLHPAKYQLQYRTAAGKQGAVELLAIDVIHDLALVRLSDMTARPLALAQDLPRHGERAYAIGYPLDVGLTLTEGISNGLVANAFGERLHYAGAINSGMSGGPTLDVNGAVIGINVAAYRTRQSVGFLVPAEHARTLLTQHDKAPELRPTPADFKAEISRQLHRHANALLAELPAQFPSQRARHLSLPGKPVAFFDCAAGGSPSLDQPVRYQTRQCSAQAGIFIDGTLTTGDISFEHNIFESAKLDSIRFSNYLEARMVTSARESFGNWAPTREFSPIKCEQRVVRNHGVDLVASICARQYQRFPGLYDLSLSFVTSPTALYGVTSKLSLTGMPFDPAFAVIERYLAAITAEVDGS
ncbi:MAG: S1C family serine protease [Burkholderiaceae bacterium]